jgi:methionyl-tRNA formyltransferase
MKITFCINKDIHAYLFLEALFRLIVLEDEKLKNSVLGSTIFFTESVGNKVNNTYLDLLASYESVLPNYLEKYSSEKIYFQKLQKNYNVKFFRAQDFSKDQLSEELKNIESDLIISVRFGKIFNENMIKAAQCPIINIHSGILPDYKGILASFWSKKHNENEYGFTIHSIEDSGIDTGSIFQIKKLTHNPNKCLFRTVNELYPLAANSIKNLLTDYVLTKKLPESFKQEKIGNYFSKPLLEDFIEYEKLGLKIINKDYYEDLLEKHF